ncbi:right-handed parallel beta-helix repeat-containing protein, partial [Candidatus Micrarchaeota archaeon]|nr:right-handed parallel beta-helix repeat-containing protein [Candidatus Micrarchaeota archaeon]
YNSSGWAMLNGTADNSTHTLSLANMDPASIYGILEYSNVPPVVQNLNATNITISSAVLNCNLTSTGNENPAAYIYWGATDGGTNKSAWGNETSIGVIGAGPFSVNASGLNSSTTYFYRCYANNSAGESWGAPTINFTTSVNYNVSGCLMISDSGTYVLSANLSGLLPVGACIYINASDVSVDCDGHSVTYTNSGRGIWADHADNVTIRDCHVDGYQIGIDLDDSDGSSIDPSSFCNSGTGAIINRSDNAVFENSIACNNTQRGIYVLDSDNVVISGSRTYNNGRDLLIENGLGSPISFAMSSMVFDRPAGDMQDYSSLSVSDSVSASSGYYFNWTANPGALPANYTAFHEKYVTIDTVSGTVSVDAVNWTWTNDEAVGFNESRLEIWGYSGSWANMGAAISEAANTLSLSGLSPSGDYGILYNGTPLNATTIYLYHANITNVTDLPRWEGGPAANASTAGGNVTNLNISGTMLTDRWAGYYGNITAEKWLRENDSGEYVYSWTWSAANGGTVCLSTNSTAYEVDAMAASAGDIDSAWGFGNMSDSAAYTFTSTNCSLDFGAGQVSNTAYADTGSTGGFITCAIKNAEMPPKPGLFFCTAIQQNGQFWNGENGNFEVLVPANDAQGATETYYFYVNLD